VAQTYGTPLERRLAERAETPQEWRGAPLRGRGPVWRTRGEGTGGGGSTSGSEPLEGSAILRSDARTTAFRMSELLLGETTMGDTLRQTIAVTRLELARLLRTPAT